MHGILPYLNFFLTKVGYNFIFWALSVSPLARGVRTSVAVVAKMRDD